MNYFIKLLKNIRFYVLVASLIISASVYLYYKNLYTSGSLLTIKLTQSYALLAITYLYFALLAGPLCFIFKFLPFRASYFKSRRAIGVSSFYFAILHAYFAFFGQLGGFGGLGFLSNKYLFAISLSFISLVILTLVAATSSDMMVAKLTFKRWKLLHKAVYIAGFLILIHALMLGTHFASLSSLIPQIFLLAFTFLMILEAIRIDAYIQKKFITLPRFGLTMVVVLSLGISLMVYFLLPNSIPLSLGIHATHIQLAKDAQNLAVAPATNLPPSLVGDRTRRFTVSFGHPDKIQPNQNAVLTFQVFDASSGNQVQFFSVLYQKVMHLVIVDNELTYFSHIHPDLNEKNLTVTTQFPKSGVYHLYLNFQPLGAIEQQFAFTLAVGDGGNSPKSEEPADLNLTKTFGQYEVTITYPKPLIGAEMAIGNQKITFTISDAKTHQPVTNLKPYLAAFGHLVMINEATFDYLHVHPTNIFAPKPDAFSGPTVEFLPLGLYGPIKSGVYRMFAQFNPNDTLFVTDFTVKIE
jgi:DMSO/TMAO reductase YedYZ heme-binding membrane subunit